MPVMVEGILKQTEAAKATVPARGERSPRMKRDLRKEVQVASAVS